MSEDKKLFTDVYGFFVLRKNTRKYIMENIFSRIRVDNTFKTTSYNRMYDLNMKLKKYIIKFFTKKVSICDFGISSGQSTLELYKDINQKRIKNIYGFDKQIYLKIFKFKKFIFLYSFKDELILAEYNKNCLRYRYFFLFKKIEKILLNIFKFLNIEYNKSNVLIPVLSNINKCKFFEQDIFNIKKKYYNSFDVIRVSNLLNESYFSKTKLKLAVNNIKKISKENCIILINRTNKRKINIGSFFIKKKNKFKLIEDINGGTEIKNLILHESSN